MPWPPIAVNEHLTLRFNLQNLADVDYVRSRQAAVTTSPARAGSAACSVPISGSNVHAASRSRTSSRLAQVAEARRVLGCCGVGGWPRHGRAPVGAGEEQRAAAGRQSLAAPARRRDPAVVAEQSALRRCSAAAASLPAALQSIFGWSLVRQSRRQRDQAGTRCAAAHPHRSLGDALFERARRIRWRRTAGRGHVRSPPRETARRTHGVVSIEQPAQRSAGDPRRAGRVILLDSEHDPRRCRADAAVRFSTTLFSRSPGMLPTIRRPCSSPPSTTTCCDGGPRCRRLRPSTVASGLAVLPARTSPTSDRPACRSPAAASPSRRA